MSFAVPTFRYSSPGKVSGKLPMSPLRKGNEINLGGLKGSLGAGMGAFFGKKQEREWKEDLKKRDEERGRTPGAQYRRIQELNIEDTRNINRNRHSHEMRLKTERARHEGGFGELGATDDRLSVSNSALAGDVGSHSPRFLETFPTKPKSVSEQMLKLRASENVLTLGSQPMEPVTKENRSINYDPIVHKYIGEPRTTTDLQRRAKKERTGYVTIAGGRKDLAEDMRTCDALQSTMQGYVEYEHQKVDPVQTWLVDEQQAATGGLRTFPAQKGVSPLTRRLVQAHPNSRVRDWHVNDQQRAAKLKQITDVRVAVNQEQRYNHEKKMALQLSTFKIKDPYSDHVWGINHEREAQPYRGFNVAFQQHYHPEDERINTKNEKNQTEAKRQYQIALKAERVKEQEHNIVSHHHKVTGIPSGIVVPRPTKRLNKTYAAAEKEKGNTLFGTIRHEDSLDVNKNLYQSTGAAYGSHVQHRIGVKSGTQNQDFVRFQPGEHHHDHGGVHANDESVNQKDKKWEHHGHEDSADRYGSGRTHVHGGVHSNDESSQRNKQWEKHAHEDAASRYGTGRVHVHGGAHTQEESATEEVWNAGSDEKYKHMENRKNGANLIKRRKSITHGIGSDQHVTIAAQNKAKHRLSIAGDVTNRPANIPLSAYAHHKEYGMAINPSDESAGDVITGVRGVDGGSLTHHIRQHPDHQANHGEDFARYDHKQHHHDSYKHNEEETTMINQFHGQHNAANLDGEQNRFYHTDALHETHHHNKAVGIDETTASHQIWEAMRSKGYEKVEQRTAAPKAKADQTANSVKAITQTGRIPIVNAPRSDHWKYDGEKDVVYVPRPPPRRTNATRGVARFI